MRASPFPLLPLFQTPYCVGGLYSCILDTDQAVPNRLALQVGGVCIIVRGLCALLFLEQARPRAQQAGTTGGSFRFLGSFYFFYADLDVPNGPALQVGGACTPVVSVGGLHM